MLTTPTDIREMARDISVETRVPSFTTPGKFYIVRHAFTPLAHCTCPDFEFRGLDKGTCKHIELVKKSVRAMAKLVKDLALEHRARNRHPVARGAASLAEAADVLASTM